MMKHFCKSGGFTLVEMVICIAIASLVTMAATTVLMLALRVNRQTSDTASQQNTVRALLSTMEKAATDGNITKVVSKLDSWQLIGVDISTGEDGQEVKTEKAIFSFDSFDRTISANGIVVLEGVYASNAILEDNLLSISIETKEGIFESTVYCRLGIDPGEGESTKPTVPADPQTTLDKFLAALIGELNSSGKIQNGSHAGKYYSEWYTGQTYVNGVGQGGWNASTPWCACYVSWALVEAEMEDPTNRIDANGRKIQWYADVDKFLAYLKQVKQWSDRSEVQELNPGDLVFFDWITDDGIQNPQHVGVVLKVDDNYIITIEGNSAGRVAMRRYELTDQRILGYGQLIA